MGELRYHEDVQNVPGGNLAMIVLDMELHPDQWQIPRDESGDYRALIVSKDDAVHLKRWIQDLVETFINRFGAEFERIVAWDSIDRIGKISYPYCLEVCVSRHRLQEAKGLLEAVLGRHFTLRKMN